MLLSLLKTRDLYHMDKERISGDSAVKNVPEPHDTALHNHDENKSSASYLKSIFDTMPDWV
jgi:hypothetical protein